jgi:hypothetical protein
MRCGGSRVLSSSCLVRCNSVIVKEGGIVRVAKR